MLKVAANKAVKRNLKSWQYVTPKAYLLLKGGQLDEEFELDFIKNCFKNAWDLSPAMRPIFEKIWKKYYL